MSKTHPALQPLCNIALGDEKLPKKAFAKTKHESDIFMWEGENRLTRLRPISSTLFALYIKIPYALDLTILSKIIHDKNNLPMRSSPQDNCASFVAGNITCSSLLQLALHPSRAQLSWVTGLERRSRREPQRPVA